MNYPSTPENTSLSSSNSVNPSSYEQSSTESLYKRREQQLQQQQRRARKAMMKIDELSNKECITNDQVTIKHERLSELKRESKLTRHSSAKW